MRLKEIACLSLGLRLWILRLGFRVWGLFGMSGGLGIIRIIIGIPWDVAYGGYMYTYSVPMTLSKPYINSEPKPSK